MVAKLPSIVRQIAQEALVAMRAVPYHHLAPYQRKTLYDAMEKASPAIGRRARGWLAVAAAERVLPLIETAPLLDDQLPIGTRLIPRQLLTMAYDVLHGRTASASVFQEAAQAYELFANLMNETMFDPVHFPLNALMAGLATSKAASEATGWDAFRHMTQHEQTRWLSVKASDEGIQSTDEQFVFNGGDTAATAVVAFAGGPTSTACEPEKLEEFWTWWLTEALPAAWAIAESSQDPT